MTTAANLLPDARLASLAETGDATTVLSARTREVDALVREFWRTHLEPHYGHGMALVAVGGYGRQELFPHSDVDLLILVEKEPETAGRDVLARFLTGLWDRKLRVSHSVRVRQDCCELNDQNIELSISLLDQRFLCGDDALYGRLAGGLPKFFQAERQGLLRHLCRLGRARHARFQNTIYHLEPDIKEAPGGLRDLHLIHWIHRLRGLPVDFVEALRPSRERIFALRCYLHWMAGRDGNLLSFDLQEEYAALPFLAIDSPDPAVRASRWMREYFRHARVVFRSARQAMEIAESRSSSLLASFTDWQTRLSNSEFTVSRERVYLRTPQHMESDPAVVLRFFRFVARHGIRPAGETERRIQELLPRLRAYFSQPAPLWPELSDLLVQPHAFQALESLHETGVLGALFPEWAAIECLVVRDFYHRYTVDEHTLIAIGALTRLRGSTDAAVRRFADLFTELEQPEVLLLALLFHDVGKGEAGSGHAAVSVRLVRTAMERIGVPAAQQANVCFLVERHLELSAIMNSRDLDEAATARYAAGRIGTLERLRMLTLLTFADISAVHPTAMTPWRMEQLWRVYSITRRELARELDADRIQPPAELTSGQGAFLDGLPTRYLRTHSQAEVNAHLALAQRCGDYGVAVDIVRSHGVFRLTVITRDKPFLFASIAGALSSFGLDILKAEAFANRRGEILDTFVFTDPTRNLELNPQEVERLRVTVERAVLGKVDVRQLLQYRPRRTPPSRRATVSPSVVFDNDISPACTFIEIVAADRPGLLYELSSQLSEAGCNIEIVLIDTEGHKAIDVFYVKTGGGQLPASRFPALREKLLAVCGF